MAERKGFEPLIPCGIRALQARALGQTTQPLRAILQDASKILPLTRMIGKDKEILKIYSKFNKNLVFSFLAIALSPHVNYNIATRAVSSVG